MKVGLSYFSPNRRRPSFIVNFNSKLPDDWWLCQSYSNGTTSNYSRETLVLNINGRVAAKSLSLDEVCKPC